MISDILSNSFIISNNRNILPAVVVAEKGSIHLSQVEIKGNINHETIGTLFSYFCVQMTSSLLLIGIIVKKGNAVIEQSKIYGHLFGGVAIWSNKLNKVRISNSKIYKNSRVGIHCVGEVSY